ncbi:2-phospho-L-lactate guanylyltransferase [Phototrophicus methaneseepsis]|uniref:Phosphoenolpyruvate guanylyltransferase n=1 Tax=Phototrophicus methaneseepsis TaxID=2710758 RepID=A0A7S8IDE7_9CHLR|nr:2-phospho-L-lactate guanylyltransferase [Phototrophicus methaneseepsis]QPC81492.1 2-phospho-L-lactate guanylyltransferase [Phototrophicus methaneseepsis]
MTIWAIVPVKPLRRAKTRLADVLTSDQRYQLAEMMLRQVLAVLDSAPQITGTLVISRDPEALSIARDMGARTIQESSASDLNPALTRATEIIRVWGAGATLIIPADLPFVNVADIAAIAHQGRNGPCVVISKDLAGLGTNALLVRPPGLITYAYGEDSYTLHTEAAQRAGAAVYTYDSDSLMLDIDVPEDLVRYNQLVGNGEFTLLTRMLPDISISPSDMPTTGGNNG